MFCKHCNTPFEIIPIDEGKSKYCKNNKAHVACLNYVPNEKKKCQGTFMQRGMTVEDAQGFLDNHNIARRLIAHGKSPFPFPQAANMAKVVRACDNAFSFSNPGFCTRKYVINSHLHT